METNEVIIILALAAIFGVVFVGSAGILATYKSLPQWAQSLVSGGTKLAVAEIETVTDASANKIDDALLDALIERLELAGVITRTQTVDRAIFTNSTPSDVEWITKPAESESKDTPDDDKAA